MDKNLCSVCGDKEHRYTCPRCNVRYCSLDCYKDKKHAACSELFYQDWFIKEMKERHVSDAERQHLLETIQKVEEENPIIDFLDASDEASLEERLRGLNVAELKESEVDYLWSRLTETEKEDFKRRVASGVCSSAASLTEPWKPWWLVHSSGLISEIDAQDISTSLPDLIPNVSSLTQMLSSNSKPHSPLIAFNLLNVLYTYVFFQRLYNGCAASEFKADFCENCLISSDVLSKNRNYNNAEESLHSAIQMCTETARSQELSADEQLSIECFQDVSHILIGPNPNSVEKYACCSLSELHKCMTWHRKKLKSQQLKSSSQPDQHKEHIKLLFAVCKKLEFLMAWCVINKEQLSILSIEVTELYKQKMRDYKVHAEMKQNVNKKLETTTEKSKKEKPLIVELD